MSFDIKREEQDQIIQEVIDFVIKGMWASIDLASFESSIIIRSCCF